MISEASAERATVTFKQLQGHSVTVSMHREYLKSLMLFYIECVSAKGLFSADGGEADTLDPYEWNASTSKKFAASLVEVKSFIDDQGSFVSETLASMDDEELKDVVTSVTTLFINVINGIDEIVSERDPNNRGVNSEDSKLTPISPQDLVLIRISEFSAIVRSQKERLLARWTLEEIEFIEQEHGEMLNAVRCEPALKSTSDSLNGDSTFDESWGVVEDRFKYLQRLCGEVATVFPGTSQVQSDFSILKNEKDGFRNSITDYSLEGVLNCKQMKMLTLIAGFEAE